MQKIFDKTEGMLMRNLVLMGIILLSIPFVYSAFCCRDPDTFQLRCFVTGECCDGYWYPACYDFSVEVEGTQVFRVGQKTPITVYIENIGYYSDSYSISGVSDNPLILLDMSDASSVSDVSEGQIKKIYPKVTVLSGVATGTITFTVDSLGSGNQKVAVFNVLESDEYLSLPEFQTVYLILSVFVFVVVFKLLL